MMKTCSRCSTTKPLSDFHRNKAKRDGRCALCKECACAATRAHNAAHPKEKRDWRLRRQYGSDFDSDVFDAMFAAQGGLCGLCGRPVKNVRGPGIIAVDHDHVTGLVRGILHAKCNVALGVVEDVGAAPFAAYLRRAARARLKVVSS